MQIMPKLNIELNLKNTEFRINCAPASIMHISAAKCTTFEDLNQEWVQFLNKLSLQNMRRLYGQFTVLGEVHPVGAKSAPLIWDT